MIASALFFAPALCRAGAVTNASINGTVDDDAQFVTSTASATTTGPAAIGTAGAQADLASGTLKARTEGDTADAFGGALGAVASSELTDALFLTPEPGSSTSPVPFSLFMDLDGFLFVGGGGLASLNLQVASARAIAMLEISGLMVSGASPASITVTRRVQAAAGIVLDDSTTVDVQQNTSGTVLADSFDVRLIASAMVTPNSAINVRAFLSAHSAAEAGFDSLADLSQTGQLGVIVPDGYSLSSSSGVFLTVPEPGASDPFALATIALLAAVRRRARTSRRHCKVVEQVDRQRLGRRVRSPGRFPRRPFALRSDFTVLGRSGRSRFLARTPPSSSQEEEAPSSVRGRITLRSVKLGCHGSRPVPGEISSSAEYRGLARFACSAGRLPADRATGVSLPVALGIGRARPALCVRPDIPRAERAAVRARRGLRTR